MKFFELELNDAFIIELEKFTDQRGFFARTFDHMQFEEKGLESTIVQTNISFTEKKGTIRGLHYQINPFEETKIVMCSKGKIFDVIIDVRKKSNTFGKWIGLELNGKNSKILYIPKGFAHGFQTLEDNSQVIYQNSQIHKPEYEKGIRWDDPFFKIKWPLNEKIISDKDESWKNFEEN
jgi:dTDP-4-dehydrorhamnose 3,5-epimerase